MLLQTFQNSDPGVTLTEKEPPKPGWRYILAALEGPDRNCQMFTQLLGELDEAELRAVVKPGVWRLVETEAVYAKHFLAGSRFRSTRHDFDRRPPAPTQPSPPPLPAQVFDRVSASLQTIATYPGSRMWLTTELQGGPMPTINWQVEDSPHNEVPETYHLLHAQAPNGKPSCHIYVPLGVEFDRMEVARALPGHDGIFRVLEKTDFGFRLEQLPEGPPRD